MYGLRVLGSLAAVGTAVLLGWGLLALPAAALGTPGVAYVVGLATLAGMLYISVALLLPGRLSGLRWPEAVGTGSGAQHGRIAEPSAAADGGGM